MIREKVPMQRYRDTTHLPQIWGAKRAYSIIILAMVKAEAIWYRVPRTDGCGGIKSDVIWLCAGPALLRTRKIVKEVRYQLPQTHSGAIHALRARRKADQT